MPTTPLGLIVVAASLVPGFVHHVWRRSVTPQKSASVFVETANFVTVSVAVDLAALGIFGLARFPFGEHLPDPRLLLSDPSGYGLPRLGSLLAWGILLLVLASGLALALAARWGPIGWVADRFTPTIVDVSSWYYVFESVPTGHHVYVGVDLIDGEYVAGLLDWYSTETRETGDRDVVLAPPLSRMVEGEELEIEGVERLVLSARDIRRIFVSFVADPSLPRRERE